MTERSQMLGLAGERIASQFLEKHGYEVIDRNVRRAEGEIDLVAIKDDVTAFVEVKLRTSRRMGAAVQQISSAKGARLVALAEAYQADHPEIPANLRIDLIAIELTVGGDVGQLNHIQSAIEG
ncbi:MAG: YraN family protein [Chloroflexi bacterium]|nr:YraN family protein [Chloroflexota bacterium]